MKVSFIKHAVLVCCIWHWRLIFTINVRWFCRFIIQCGVMWLD